MRVIRLPPHQCLPDEDGRAVPYGDLDARNVATCRERVRWDRGERLPGCGARIAVCHGCGLRTRINGARCGQCGGEDRPSADHALTTAPIRAVERDVDPERSIVQQEAPREDERLREAKPKAPRRAPQKRVKPAAGPEANDLPLFK